MNIGDQIGSLMNGVLNPIGGVLNNVIGTTNTTTTTGADPNKSNNSKTGLIIVSVLGVITLIIISVLIFKKQN